jgi:hypothetical protein
VVYLLTLAGQVLLMSLWLLVVVVLVEIWAVVVVLVVLEQ